jgi:hypothetical protein
MDKLLLQGADAVEISQWVYREKIKMLYVNHRHSWPASLIISALIASFSIESGQLIIGLSWWLIFVLIILIRLQVTKKFCKKPVDSANYKKCHRYFFWLTMLVGAA